MIAAFPADRKQHIINTVARIGLKVVATGYCGARANAADGVIQLPDRIFTERLKVDDREPCIECCKRAGIL